MPAPPSPRPTAAWRLHGTGLLATKLNPPALQPRQVLRDAVCARIAQSGGVRLVLVRAPAGFGKTTAMVQARDHLADSGVAAGWLTLDRADNDLPRFLRCLHQAVAQVVGHSPASESPLDVLAALARHATPFALFLDDVELITEPAVLSLLREIIDHLPRRGQLVLGSRSLPDLGLGRLRAAGHLLELDAEALRFSLDETRRFFAPRQPGHPPLSLDALAQLHARTEGWIAALWLASMALQRADSGGGVDDFIHRFNGSDRAVADYLAEDVLARQPADLRQFLLRTSVLRHLNAPLCQALNPRLDAAATLARLDAAQLFVTPITPEPGDGGQAWRYHSLFAEFLRNQLAREQPEQVARLHLTASGWYEAQGRPVPAIDHALEGGDSPHALHLLEQHAEGFLEQGRMRLLARWFAAVPPALLKARPMLQVVSLWATSFTRGPWEALARLDDSGVATIDAVDANSSADPAVRAHVDAMRPMLLAMMDRIEEAHDAGRRSLQRLPTGKPFADSVLCNAMANLLGVMGQPTEAQRLLDDARRAQQGSAFNRMYSETVAGLLDLQQGRLRQATARFRLALGAAPGTGYLPTHGNAWAGVMYAGALYEANQLAQAEHLLNVYLPLARDVGLPDHMIISHRMRARIAWQRGDIDTALQVLTELEYLGHHRQLPRVVASARLERARLLLLQGQDQAAGQALSSADDPAVWQRVQQHRLAAHDVDDLAIGQLRWQVRFGQPAAAAAQAAAWVDEACTAQRQRRVLTLRLLQALALQRAGDAAAALRVAGLALQQASAEGFMRCVLDEGPAIAPLLLRCRQARLDGAATLPDPILDDWLDRLCQELPAAAPEPMAYEPGADAPGPAGAAAPPAEPLTRKEIRVLQLLAEGYSNSALASSLSVSDSTVRTHLRSINLKLKARSRTQAVALARRLGVLD